MVWLRQVRLLRTGSDGSELVSASSDSDGVIKKFEEEDDPFDGVFGEDID